MQQSNSLIVHIKINRQLVIHLPSLGKALEKISVRAAAVPPASVDIAFSKLEGQMNKHVLQLLNHVTVSKEA